MAKAEAEGIEPDLRRLSRMAPEPASSGSTRSACSTRAAALPEQVEHAAAHAADVDGLPDHDDIENVVVLGMGGSGIAGDVARRGRRPVHGRAGAWCTRATSIPTSSDRAHARASRCRSRATPRRPSRAPPRPRPSPAAALVVRHPGRASSAALADELGAPRRARRRRHPDAARRHRRRWPSRRWWCSSGSGLFPGAIVVDRRRRRPAARADATSSSPTATRPIGWPAGSAARCRSSTAAAGSGEVAATALEEPVQRERQGPGVRERACPSCATTRSAGGASTAT